MPNKLCDACGQQPGMIGLGGTLLCRICHEDVRAEIDQIRAEGKQVNAMGIARRMYRERHDTSNTILRDEPRDLKIASEEAARKAGLTRREWILQAMQEKLERDK